MNTLVIIDDEYLVLEALRIMVEASELPLRIIGTAGNGQDGLKLLLDCRPDVVMTDIRMPGMSGLDMIEQAQEELESTSWIVMSGYREFEYAKRALLLSVVDYVEKPILRKNVVSALTKALEALEARGAVKSVVHEEPAAQPETRCAWVNECQTYLRAHFTEDVCLSDVADRLGVNPAYLSGLFKEHTGVSFIKYLTTLRMEKAKRMLREGGKAMQVGEACGYGEYHYFCRVFKKTVGMTPNEYKGGGE